MKTMFCKARWKSCQARSKCYYLSGCNHLLVGVLAIVTGLLSGCKADVDLNHIDTRVKTKVGLVIPAGSMRFTMNDFLGGAQVPNLIIDDEGVFHYKDSMNIPIKRFYDLNMADYIGTITDTIKLEEDIPIPIPASGISLPYNLIRKFITNPLICPIHASLGDLGSSEYHDRLDSVTIDYARFSCMVDTLALGIKWDWIEKIEFELADSQFYCPQGNILTIYEKQSGVKYGYRKAIPIEVRNFSINFLQSDGSQDTTFNFSFHFHFSIPDDAIVTIHPHPGFLYQFKSERVDYAAAWGLFSAGKQMRDSNTISIMSLWSKWSELKNMKLKLRDPHITLRLNHQIAAPLKVCVDQIMTKNAKGDVALAQWGDSTHITIPLPNFIHPNDPLYKTIWNEYTFDVEHGNLSDLFAIAPDSLNYKFHLAVDHNRPDYTYPQHRITRNTKIDGKAIFDLPFSFESGSEMSYVTKMQRVHFDRLQIDSLLQLDNIEVKNTNTLKLFVNVTNSLPFEFKAHLHFLDERIFPLHFALIEAEGEEDNVIHLPAPEMIEAGNKNGIGVVSKPTESTFIIDIDQNLLDSLALCKYISLDTYLGNNMKPSSIDTSSYIDIYVGIATSLEAIINFNKK